MHLLLMLGAGLYAWQLHGLMIGLGTILALWVIITISNYAILLTSGSFAWIRLNRWGWVIVAYIAVALSGASVSHVPSGQEYSQPPSRDG
ncbi:MAG: hypothetical protein KBA57_01730 [Sphingomonadaceae bacterium]|nr:hypothetical protein [Sphingomonadaceae bacterium]